MCKSANDPGGPYRCSGDMERRLEAASAAHETACEEYRVAAAAVQEASGTMTQNSMLMERRVERPDSSWTIDERTATAAEHKKALVASGALTAQEAEDLRPSDAFALYAARQGFDEDDPLAPRFEGSGDPAWSEADRRWVEANRQHRSAMAAKEKAGAAVQRTRLARNAAQDDYDATPRGLGELRRDHEQALANPGGSSPTLIQERLDRAQNKITTEARARFAKDPDGGLDHYTYQPLSTNNDPESSAAAGAMARQDKITGCARVYGAQDTPHGTPCKVTLTRRDSNGKAVEATFRVTAPLSEELSTGEVLHGLSTRARSVDTAGNDFETWREHQGVPPQKVNPDRYKRSRAEYDSIQQDSMRLGQFVGASRFFSYLSRA